MIFDVLAIKMPRNVEIKAKITINIDEFERNVIQLCCCTVSSVIVLQQIDTFFITSHGRLKLRQFINDDTSKVICQKKEKIIIF
jgi:hypothetical protein